MKRRCSVLPALVTALALCACGSGGETAVTSSDSGGAASNALPSPARAQAEEDGPEVIPSSGVDIDLTALSSTMVYSQVYDLFLPGELPGQDGEDEGQL